MLIYLNEDAVRALRECQRIRSTIAVAKSADQQTMIEESRSYASELVTEITRCNPMQAEPVTREDFLALVEQATAWDGGERGREFPGDRWGDYNHPFSRKMLRWLVEQGLMIETGNVAKDGSVLYRHRQWRDQ